MKRGRAVLLVLMMLMSLYACADTNTETKKSNVTPDASQIRSMCNLATLECYYHNVAKSTAEVSSGLFGLSTSEKEFWKEYSGVAKIGIDMSKVSVDINEDVITISVPEAKILSIEIVDDTLSDTISESADKIKTEYVAEAIENAQNDIQETIKNNTSLLANAQERAKKLIENYIDKISEISGVEYKIEWVTIPDSSAGGSN